MRRWCVGFRAVPEPSLWWSALCPRRRLLELRQVLPWKFRQVCSISVLCFGKLGTIWFCFFFPAAASDGPCFPGLEMYRLKRKWGTRGDEERPSSHSALCLYRARSQAQLNLEVGSGIENCWSRHLTMVMVNSEWGYFRFGSLWVPHFFELFRPFYRWSCNCSN